MRSPVYLPPTSDPEGVAAALRYHRDVARDEQASHAVAWTKVHWFIQGVRGVNVLGPGGVGGGAPSPTFVDSTGQRHVRLELAVQALQTEMGRLLSLDMSPAVRRKPGISLDDVRASGISQTILDNFWSRFRNSEFKLSLAFGLVTYGTVGIGAFEVPRDSGDVYGATLCLIPPWELFPLPAGTVGVDPTNSCMWKRWVSYDWVKANYGKSMKLPQDESLLRLVEAVAGSRVVGDTGPQPIGGSASGQVASNAVGRTESDDLVGPGRDTMKFVEMTNVWISGDDGSCLRWMVLLGDALVIDKDYSKQKVKPMTPVAIVRYLPVGSFWGRGLIDRLDSLNREIEALLGDMLQNLREADRLRVLTLPMMSGVNFRTLRQYLRNRFLPWQPDPNAPTQGPSILNPPTTADMHGRTLGMLSTFMSTLAGQGEMFRGDIPGRADAADALSVLAEQQNIPLTAVVESIDAGLTQAYRALLGIFGRTVKTDDEILLSRVDESSVGVVFEQKTGRVSIGQNPLPPPQSVDVHIRTRIPRSKSAIKSQLDDLLRMKIISPVQYRIAAMVEGLDLPLINRAEYENYVTAWLENLLLYGDGKTPGRGLSNEFGDSHVIHHVVHKAFMASPLFRLASPQVRDAFVEHDEGYHLEKMGAFPDGLETADQFGNVGPPGGAAMQGLIAAGPPPGPGETSPMDLIQ